MADGQQQLSIPIDESRRREEIRVRHAGELERLGETVEWGALMLRLLEASGMVVGRYEAFGGGVGVTVEIGPVSLHASGEQLADFATDLFLEAMALRSFLGAAA